jgi:hypothetical protein
MITHQSKRTRVPCGCHARRTVLSRPYPTLHRAYLSSGSTALVVGRRRTAAIPLLCSPYPLSLIQIDNVQKAFQVLTGSDQFGPCRSGMCEGQSGSGGDCPADEAWAWRCGAAVVCVNRRDNVCLCNHVSGFFFCPAASGQRYWAISCALCA